MSQEKSDALQIRGDRVVLGDWSGDLGELIAKNIELRTLLRDGRKADARALVQAQVAEEQAVLVAMDENPEEVLSLTAMDERFKPGYRPAVVEKVPAEVLAEMVAPAGVKLVRFNSELLAAMPAETFARTVEDTLDPVYYHGNRTQVSWEWLEAVAALDDHNKRAELLFRVDQSMIEDALLDKTDSIDMHAEVWAGTQTVSAFRLLSESGQAVMLPPIKDQEIAETIHSLHEAAPELLSKVVRNAWERAGSLGQ